MSVSIPKEVLIACAQSTKVMAKTFFPDRFYEEFTETIHEPIFELIDLVQPRKKIVIAAPRGAGKTSIVGLAWIARQICFGLKHFIVYVSNSATNAERQMENLKQELLTNRLIRATFGSIKTKYIEEKDNTFSTKVWVANLTSSSHPIMILPRGSGQQIRGLLFGNHRPDLVIFDDLENSEAVASEDQRVKLKEWFFADAINAVSRTDDDWEIGYIDTLKHEDALIQNLLDDPTWKGVRLSICDENYKSLAPNFMSDEEIQERLESYRSQGILDVFYREFMNQAISKEDAAFRPEYFRYYEEGDEDSKKPGWESMVLVDPAKTAKVHSAHSAIVGIGYNSGTNRVRIRDIVSGRLHPEQIIDEALDMAVRLNARVIGLEVTSLEEFITYPFMNRMLERGLSFEVIHLKARSGIGEYSRKSKGKEGRVAAMIPFYRRGLVEHNKNVCGVLESQLLAFPRPTRWDVMDATAYFVQILEMGLRYFTPSEDDEDYDPEHEYEDLWNEYDEDPELDWNEFKTI